LAVKFRTFVILEVDVDSQSVAKGASACAVAAELAREAIAQLDYAMEVYPVDETSGTVRPGIAFVSVREKALQRERVTDRIDARYRVAPASEA